MDGNSFPTSEIRSLAASVASASAVVDGLLRELQKSTVTSTDLGNRDVDRVAASYVRILRGTLSDSLAAFRLASLRLAETLERTAEQHEAAGDGNRAGNGRTGE